MKLTLREIDALNYELNGLSFKTKDGQVFEQTKGLLRQNASMKLKVYLQRLNKIVQEENKAIEETMKELFEKYAEGEKQVPKEKMDAYTKEFEEIFLIEKEIDVDTIWMGEVTIDSLSSIETNENYPIFLKLIDK